jgi:uncharacterized protein (TIGR03437 family)
MFDGVRFNAGTLPPNIVGPGLEPDCSTQRGNDCINKADLLDSNTFTTLALAVRPEFRNRVDWRRPIQWAMAHQQKRVVAKGQEFRGFSLVERPVSGTDGIAWEFTGQMVLALRLLDSIYPGEGFGTTAQTFLAQLQRAKTVAPFADGRGVPAATLPDGNDIVGLRTPFQEILQRVNLAATTTAALAEMNINPFRVPPRFSAGQVRNGAGFQPEPDNGISAGSYFSIFGVNLADAEAQLSELPGGRLPRVLGGTGVMVNGKCAPVVYVSPTQINAQAPTDIGGSTASIQIRTNATGDQCSTGSPSPPVVVPHRAIAPGLFMTANGNAAALHEDGRTVITTERPARPGEIVSLFGTGFGATEVPLPEGDLPQGINRVRATITGSVGGIDFGSEAILYAGLAPGFPGVYQFNVRLPLTLQSGMLPIRICASGICSQANVQLPVER